MTVTPKIMDEQRDYQRLLDEARSLGVPTSLDDPDTPATVDALRQAVQNARRQA